MEKNHPFKYHSGLIVKYLTNSLSAKEQTLFETWLNESQANKDLVESFRDTQKVQADINTIDAFDPEHAWRDVAHQLSPQPVRLHPFKKIIRIGAAAALLSFGLAAYWYINQTQLHTNISTSTLNIPAGQKRAAFELANGEIINLNDSDVALQSSAITAVDGTLYLKQMASSSGNYVLRTPKAGEYKMVLPDGTQVWLNASSTLTFSGNFNKANREVFLNGEAYFEVAHREAMPFTVNFNDTQVEVLGTHFNINTYEKESKTTLLEGSVKIKEGTRLKLLKPGEEATVTAQGIDVAKVETFKNIAWKEGVFLFEEEKLTDILDQIARWYDVTIQYEGTPGNKKYSGNIRRQADLQQVLEMLTTVSGTKFKLTNRILTVQF